MIFFCFPKGLSSRVPITEESGGAEEVSSGLKRVKEGKIERCCVEWSYVAISR